jgi:UDP-glucose 4-epimerase
MTTSSITCQRRALVTGAAGFIGQHLLAALSVAGWHTTALTHHRSLPRHLMGDLLTVVQGDVTDAPFLTNLIAESDVVFHLASFVPPDHLDPTYAESCVRVNSLGTLQIGQAVLGSPGCRLVFFTAGNTFPATATPGREDALGYPADYATYYLSSKLLAELYLEHLHRSRGLNAVCLRLTSAYGPGMREQSVMARFLWCAMNDQPLEVRDAGRFQVDYVHVNDVVNLALVAAESGEPGVYNVGSGHAHSILELAQAVAAVFPEHGVRIAVQPALEHGPTGFAALAIDKAVLTWGYRPLSLAEGLVRFRQELERGGQSVSSSF